MLFITKDRNKYFYSRNKKQFIVVHPILYFIIELHYDNGSVLERLIKLNDEDLVIEGCGKINKDELNYYYKKYLFLLNSGYFNDVEVNKKIVPIVKEDVQNKFLNTNQIIFEVTESCNFNCSYCGFGELYNHSDRKGKKLSIKKAKLFLNHFFKSRDEKGLKIDSYLYISFFGGEPLLNIEFIKQLVPYVRRITNDSQYIRFSLTTNGSLISNHLNYLIDNQIYLTISLDGDLKNNIYRKYKNNTSPFNDIVKAIELIKTTDPKYFKEFVNFNAVLHNKNSVEEIHVFFKQYNKTPQISELYDINLNQKDRLKFEELFNNMNESINHSENYSNIERDMFYQTPNISSLAHFVHNYLDYKYKDYYEMLNPLSKPYFLPTGTCMPFDLKLYVTADGTLLPCERIGKPFMFGKVSEKEVVINYDNICDFYNKTYEAIFKLCKDCLHKDSCKQCIFYLSKEKGKTNCNGYISINNLSKFLSSRVSYIERNREYYEKINSDFFIMN